MALKSNTLGLSPVSLIALGVAISACSNPSLQASSPKDAISNEIAGENLELACTDMLNHPALSGNRFQNFLATTKLLFKVYKADPFPKEGIVVSTTDMPAGADCASMERYWEGRRLNLSGQGTSPDMSIVLKVNAAEIDLSNDNIHDADLKYLLPSGDSGGFNETAIFRHMLVSLNLSNNAITGDDANLDKLGYIFPKLETLKLAKNLLKSNRIDLPISLISFDLSDNPELNFAVSTNFSSNVALLDLNVSGAQRVDFDSFIASPAKSLMFLSMDRVADLAATGDKIPGFHAYSNLIYLSAVDARATAGFAKALIKTRELVPGVSIGGVFSFPSLARVELGGSTLEGSDQQAIVSTYNSLDTDSISATCDGKVTTQLDVKGALKSLNCSGNLTFVTPFADLNFGPTADVTTMLGQSPSIFF